MSKKKFRYHSSFAPDWVLPLQSENPAEESSKKHVDPQPSRPDSKAKPDRYKKVLPTDWVDQETTPSKPIPPILPPLTKEGLNELGSLETAEPKRKQRDVPLVDTSIRKTRASGHTPPPGPRRSTFASVWGRQPPHFSADEPSRGDDDDRSDLRYGSKANSFHPAEFQPAAREQPISPPVSVGVSSSVLTTSPYHGRDLPVRGPRMSPSYSVVSG
ncbi:uncharacterized protein KY384_002218 [Bacidia gigantensis]|uniref:uncharacterized protein n=1 Tax=Bacidia gigantensis TaxID=2732470 RepID=UPI001D036F09|nr:uncharacterized protein KY384_002218 [Bacidia gigantensis]KAG8533435.1 hypothetical protein KY384_002218 [Bacidia gigantensis]